MLRRTLALALLTAAAGITASAANTAYDRAASMAAGETALGRGYDGANVAGAVKASVSGALGNGGLTAPNASPARTAMNASAVPSPNDDKERAGKGMSKAARLYPPAVLGAVVGAALGGPIGALFGAALGFGIALLLSKTLS